MLRRSVEVKGVRLSIDVPERYAPAPVRRLVRGAMRAVRPRPEPPEQPRVPLIFREVPTVGFNPRDPDVALAFLSDEIDRKELLLDGTAVVDSPSDPEVRQLAEQVAAYPWYHTIELPHGIVTAGAYDHRPLVARYGIPDDLEGKRVLDVATSDGFWAFEFERRGAKVTALDVETTDDLDLPMRAGAIAATRGLCHPIGGGFELARRALGSGVERVGGTVYDLDPDRMGRFDLVHSGDLLIHLRDPCRALERIRSVTAGQALLSEVFEPALGAGEPGLVRYLGGWEMVGWWVPALDTLVQMIGDAGFSQVDVITVYSLRVLGASEGPWRAVVRARP